MSEEYQNIGKMWYLIKSDMKRFGKRVGVFGLYRIISSPSFRVTFWYRIGHYLIYSKQNLIKKILLPFIKIIHRHNAYLTGIQLEFKTKVGESLLFGHFSNIVINDNTIIGNNVTISQGVTTGWTQGKSRSAPIIGDNCILAPGCKILGPITLGKNCFVGVNAVITKSFSDNCVLGGVNKIINMNGEKYVRDFSNLHF